jgi:hypothetical protein
VPLQAGRVFYPWPADDSTRWKEHDAYGKALERLPRDLKVAAADQSPAA